MKPNRASGKQAVETRYRASLQGGASLLEIVIALLLSLTAFLVAAPALALSLKILTVDRTGLDQEIAVEAAWNEICASPSQFARAGEKDFSVGENRSLTVQVTPLESHDGLWRWRLSVPPTGYNEERWLAK
ncbi:MAG TPA: hypothetical protein VGQ81_13585 [Acidobacteriota bacterium]|nr:hypothetical protein [Acidobacteriota bacterium]